MISDSSIFSDRGLGAAIGDGLTSAIFRRVPNFDGRPRGKNLFIGCDIGGSHKQSNYETFSFVVFDLDLQQKWLEKRSTFRGTSVMRNRRMSYKSLNDQYRRRALPKFLEWADELDGFLINVSFKKGDDSIFEPIREAGGDKLLHWKPSVRERLLRLLHLYALLMTGFAKQGQNVFLFIDRDEAVANDKQLAEATSLLGNVYSNMEGPFLGHLKFGSAKSDDGSLALEDVLAISDFAAAGASELLQRLYGPSHSMSEHLLTKLSKIRPIKLQHTTYWLCSSNSLQKVNILLNAPSGTTRTKATFLRFDTYSGLLST